MPAASATSRLRDAAHTVLTGNHQQRHEGDEGTGNHACGQVWGVQAADLTVARDTDTLGAGCGVSYQPCTDA